ncbi:hypothetical protein LOSG293_030550 [Secundilactobacillus oryzae JCM 18671]|uniref:Peptidase C39-like domain-containing protein n=1 Tax=Secundilactobacillus oryzae JCM 18671 TaxID=1291743 RepID=A0A081BGP8_9LACO|nr:C39 family peptidase [Secundilactobacillus oryzae]GAK47216.1 hypothetical protein LOSG293_030550 [Secundilactobacillus oryzae JCM 18671]
MTEKQFLGVPNIDQIAFGAENGCEAASLLEGFWYKGKLTNLSYLEFLKQMPIAEDANPYHGFGGSPFRTEPGNFEAIFTVPLKRWSRRYGSVRDLTGANVNWLYNEVNHGNPVLAYVTVHFEKPVWKAYKFGEAPVNNHAVILDGVNDSQVHVSDPIDGQYWLKRDQFEQIYNARKMAIVIL